MKYLIKKDGRPYYIRRVPKALKPYHPRSFVKIALRTDNEEDAHKAALTRNDEVKAYWQSLLESASLHSEDKFKAAVSTANTLGFKYHSA